MKGIKATRVTGSTTKLESDKETREKKERGGKRQGRGAAFERQMGCSPKVCRASAMLNAAISNKFQGGSLSGPFSLCLPYYLSSTICHS